MWCVILSASSRHKEICKTIDKILKAIPEESVNVKMLSHISGISPATISKYVDLVYYIQQHPIKIFVSEIPNSERSSRHIRRLSQ